MNRDEVIQALEALAEGRDSDANPVVVFTTAVTLLKARPRAAGARWTGEEDARLLRAFDEGMSVAQIAAQHGRTAAAISLRLVMHGRIDAAHVKTRQRGARLAS